MHSHLAKMLGQYILEQRTDQDIQQRKLAKSLRISAQFLGRIEKGEVMIPDDLLLKCMNILKLDKSKIVTIYRLAGEKKAQMIVEACKQMFKSKKSG